MRDGGVTVDRVVPRVDAVVVLREVPPVTPVELEETVVALAHHEHDGVGWYRLAGNRSNPPNESAVRFLPRLLQLLSSSLLGFKRRLEPLTRLRCRRQLLFQLPNTILQGSRRSECSPLAPGVSAFLAASCANRP